VWLALSALSLAAPAAEAPPAGLPEANEFLQGLAQRQRVYEQALNAYTYDVLATEEQLDGQGRIKSTLTRGYEVFHVRGVPVRKQVVENGQPLSPKQQVRESGRVEKQLARIGKRSAEDQERGVRLSKILERFAFESVAREQLDGRATLLIDFEPRPGKTDLEHDKQLRILTGRLWVDEQSRAIVRAHLRNNAPLKIALGLGASLSELDLQIDFARVDDVWLPSRSEAFVAGRILLFKGLRQRQRETYGRYRKFEVTSEEALQPAG